MATFLVNWERFCNEKDHPSGCVNWLECYEYFSGPLQKTKKRAVTFMERIENDKDVYGETRRIRLFKLVSRMV